MYLNIRESYICGIVGIVEHIDIDHCPIDQLGTIYLDILNEEITAGTYYNDSSGATVFNIEILYCYIVNVCSTATNVNNVGDIRRYSISASVYDDLNIVCRVDHN